VISAAKKIFPGSLAVSKRNCIELLLPVVPSLTQEFLEQKLAEVQEKTAVYTKDKRVLIGVGGECLHLEDYHRSYQQAQKALDISQFFTKQNRIVFYDQLGIYSLLLEINDLTLLQKLVTNKLGPLLNYDRKKNSSVLADTLETYLRTGGSLKETAPELFIHVATLKYRITRIEDLLNIDLRKTENHFDLQLALFAHRFMKKNQSN
jgi:DNA-binding PucR family transcriptional regulator